MPWIVMPYVNNPDLTQRALDSALAQEGAPSVLLIANGTPPLLTPLDPRVRTWAFSPGLPLAAVWNRALQFVWETGETEALVVNNDVILPPALLTRLSRVRARTEAWFVTACNVGADYRHDAPIPESGLFDCHSDDPLRAGAYISTRGGPDFSCFLIHRDGHRWFQFDTGFAPAYHEDNDYHRRLQLAGFGDRIFSVPVPYFHEGSGTLKSDPALQARWEAKFQRSQDHYRRKWGGLPGHETLTTPFGLLVPPEMDPRVVLTGQGTVDTIPAAAPTLFSEGHP